MDNIIAYLLSAIMLVIWQRKFNPPRNPLQWVKATVAAWWTVAIRMKTKVMDMM